ncbi:MAG: phosphatidylinositol-specific phospholipase C1-like protein [Phenylobacterium sp.]|uniref:phosphatidylinositol-specific phospholipase C1-like protein n=1 Tax=Phenylobacterium sp. TaxID=1871053 RepID=UPI001A3F7855|nr:phosphatidylinositol-specific phospholipase C1-like protein [Phenylobacterium sp.]MBL8771215.1 phosphatidylinositol-specific phospholipase C1-like protein [Phenylobacterium sp.]
MIAALLAAAAVSATCDLERPSGEAGCTRAVVDRLPMNAIQVIGTHNSYKMAIAPNEFALIRAVNPKEADAIDYSHPPLPRQLDAGARQLELDIVYDPQVGLYANPLGYRSGQGKAPYDFAPLKLPGLKVLHEPSVDYRSVCPRFTDCLSDIRAWSKAHPGHVPILVILNLKEGGLSLPGATVAPRFDAAGMDAIDREIRSVFPEAALITPDQVQGRHATLREAAAAGAWPRLKAARGRVMFALDYPPDQVARYREQRRVLEGRVAFVNIDESSPAAGYITLNEPQTQRERIAAAVRAGLIVRTRADADTREARAGDTSRQTAAFASGAQYVSTDYMQPDARFGPYVARVPGGVAARLSPVEPPGR